MPYLHIRSLPIAGAFDPAAALRAISADFARAVEIDEQHVTVTWETFDEHHYADGGKTAPAQRVASHAVLVSLLAPDFNSPERIETMLRSAAAAVAHQAGVSLENVFVHFRPARSGEVFDGGDVVRW